MHRRFRSVLRTTLRLALLAASASVCSACSGGGGSGAAAAALPSVPSQHVVAATDAPTTTPSASPTTKASAAASASGSAAPSSGNGATPGAAPTSLPTAQPTTLPTIVPAATACDGDPAEIPSMPQSVWCQAMPVSPAVASNSSAIVSFYAQNDFVQQYESACCSGFLYQFGATNTVSSPQYAVRDALYWAKSTDPTYTISDSGQYNEQTVNDTINIPSGALPESGGFSAHDGESHMTVIDPTHTYEYDFVQVSAITPGSNGSPGTITTTNVVKALLAQTNGWGCDHPYIATLYCTGGNIDSTSRLLSQGIVDPTEIMSGTIGHAIALNYGCGTGHGIAPGLGGDSPCAAGTTNALSGGQRLFLAACPTYPNCTALQSTSTIASWTLPAPLKIVLNAMAAYGMYTVDTDGPTGNDFYIESLDPRSYNSSHAVANNWPTLGATYGLSAYPNGGLGDYGYDFDFRAIPTNPNGPPGAVGWWSWVAICSTSGC